MFLFVFFICFYAMLFDGISTKEARIIGGYTILESREKFPYQVSIRIDGRHRCGGSIISYKHILTAAHCCVIKDNEEIPASKFLVVAGILKLYFDHNALYCKVARIFVHENFDSSISAYDISILLLSDQFNKWDKFIAPVRLAVNMPEVNTTCVVTGWGNTVPNIDSSSEYLVAVHIPLLDITICNYYYYGLITKDMLCAGEPQKDACQGDSGGPLVCSGEQIGIVSWGHRCGLYPGVYANVPYLLSWISQIEERSCGFNQMGHFFYKIFTPLTLLLIYF